MSRYFRIIGYALIILFFVSAIIDLIFIIIIGTNNHNSLAYLIPIFIFCIFAGPANGMLFISHANLLDKQKNQDSYINKKPIGASELTKAPKSEIQISKISIRNGILKLEDEDESYNITYIKQISNMAHLVKFQYLGKEIVIKCESKGEAKKLIREINNHKIW